MSLDLVLLIGGALIVAATLSTRLAQRFGVPSLLLFVVLGMLAGSSGPGGLVFANYALALDVGFIALAVILFSGGLDTEMATFRTALLPAALLSTFGVLLMAAILGLGAWLLTPLGALPSLVLGAVLAPTDAAAVFSVLKGRGLSRRLRGLLEVESGTNDPVSIHLTLALTALATGGAASPWNGVLAILMQLALGALIGWAAGHLLAMLINTARLDSYGLFPVLSLAGALAIFGLTNLIGGNGFLAVYLLGLVLGNRRIVHRSGIRTFMDSAAWTAQITMFVLLGLLVFPDRMLPWVPHGLLVTALVIFVARPLAVFGILIPLGALAPRHRLDSAELTIVNWAGLKGAVPIILAIIPLLRGMPEGETLFHLVFVAVIVGAAVQGLTIVPLASRLGLTNPEPPTPPVTLELGGAAPVGSAVLDLFLYGDEPAVGKTLREVNVPSGLVVAAIHRGERMVTPRGDVEFRAGDHLFLLTDDVDHLQLPRDFRRPRRNAGR